VGGGKIMMKNVEAVIGNLIDKQSVSLH
jgi:hypothetical protein